jgi:hypothetical protein
MISATEDPNMRSRRLKNSDKDKDKNTYVSVRTTATCMVSMVFPVLGERTTKVTKIQINSTKQTPILVRTRLS